MKTDMTNRSPAEIFPPGEYIQDELDARGWTQDDLAQILGRPLNAVNQIIKGKRGITPETARGLGAAFGTSAEMWMNLENAYQLANLESDKHNEVSRRARLFSIAPVNEMVRRGWIASGNIDQLEDGLQRFFSTSDLDRIQPLSMAARKSTSYEETTSPQLAWGYRALRLARAVQAGGFSASRLANELPKLRALAEHPENIRKIPLLLASWGVRLVLVSHLEKTRIDGATLWLDAQNPVVAMSLRFDRIDYFWHTLIHELIHVKKSHATIDSDLVSDAKGERGLAETTELEQSVNTEAAALLVQRDKLESFIIRTSPLYSREKVVRFAQANGVHPGIVVGQLHHRYLQSGDGIPPKNFRDLLVPVRQLIIGQTITDGWGHNPGAF